MKKGKVVAIIQARMQSTRLPGKVTLDLGGKPVLAHVVSRAAAIPGVDQVVVAAPAGSADAPVRELARSLGVEVYAGSESDVLDRFYRAALAAKADVVLRITADCPFLDPVICGRVVKALSGDGVAYATNTAPPSYPDGLDVEVFRFDALKTAWSEARLPLEREHVTPFLRNHPERFKAVNVANDRDLSGLRWTLDEPADLEFLRAVHGKLNGHGARAGFKDILRLIEKDPALRGLNGGIKRNEGYYLSMLKTAPIPARKLKVKRSLELLKKSEVLIPGSSQTFSKAPNQFVRGVAPLFLQKGRGCRVWDVDGNEFLDTTMALAPVSLGYCDPDVDAEIREQLKGGTVLSQPHPLEAEVARTIVDLVPCAEMIRFGKSGSDATSGAVRLARAYTGREIVLAGGYHGWHDWFIGTTTRNGGVPKAVQKLTQTFKYNDIDSLHRLFKKYPGQVAAVILEPIGIEEPRDGFLEKAAALTRKNGALLIFDEVVTGFRFALGGAQEYYGVTPDLGCFGKAVANGMPLAVIAGKAKIMRMFNDIFFSFTFGGELLSLAAARATLAKMQRQPVIPRIWEQGQRMKDGFNTLARSTGLEKHAFCIGLAPHSVVVFKDAEGQDWWELKSLFQQECVRRGLLFMGSHNPCFAHTSAETDRILKVYASALPVLAQAVREKSVKKRLQGPPVEAIFRKP